MTLRERLAANETVRPATNGQGALALHAWIGMRDILMDYVHHSGVRLALTLAVIVTLAACVLWMAAVLWGAR